MSCDRCDASRYKVMPDKTAKCYSCGFEGEYGVYFTKEQVEALRQENIFFIKGGNK